MGAKLPNLELLEYKIREKLQKDEDFMEEFERLKEDKRWYGLDLSFDMFLQMWGNTSGGFEGVGGCAMTEQYTVVVHERHTNIYIVCFGETPCYMVRDANQEFYDDLTNRNIKGLHSAKGVY